MIDQIIEFNIMSPLQGCTTRYAYLRSRQHLLPRHRSSLRSIETLRPAHPRVAKKEIIHINVIKMRIDHI